jgi:uncharacterized protein (TIGR03000 family)
MLRKYFLAPAILSLALMFVAAEAAQAQIRIQVGRPSYGGYYGGYGRGYYPGYYNQGYYGSSYYSPYYGPYSSGYYSTYPSTSYYYSPAPSYYVNPAPVTDNTANIRVLLPDPNARVWFNGNLTSQQGTDRLFTTPPLSYGTANVYMIRATWMQGGREVTQERTVSATPGGTFVVDFTR